jgi:site-specific recombinase XerC
MSASKTGASAIQSAYEYRAGLSKMQVFQSKLGRRLSARLHPVQHKVPVAAFRRGVQRDKTELPLVYY